MLYPWKPSLEAVPKNISRRTSYRRVRLEFHRLPQIIREFFNIHRFGPPRGVTLASTCSWQDHMASGLILATERPVQTRFRYGSAIKLNLAAKIKSPAHSSIGTPSPINGLRSFVSIWFHVLFHSPYGVLFTFPSRYLFAIGRSQYLALEDGPPGFLQDFSSPVVLGKFLWRYCLFKYETFTLYGASFQKLLLRQYFSTPWYLDRDTQELPQHQFNSACQLLTLNWFRLIPFRSPLLRESLI